MMRSLYSAISGLKNHQTMMDVIGNNIANVNTTGFKSSRVTFATQLSQTLRGASAPDTVNTPPAYGGTNAVQVGLGAALGSIDQIMNQGSTQTTGNATDMMIQGDGFFVLSNNGQTVYTRAGNFTLDSEGNLVSPGSGALVQGQMFNATTTAFDPNATPLLQTIKFKLGDTWDSTNGNVANTGNPPSNLTLTSYTIDKNGVITGVYTDSTTGQSQIHQIGQIALASFPNPSGLQNIGGSFYTTSNNSGNADIGTANTGGRGSIMSSALEMSNVDLSQEMTNMIVAQRGFQANSRVITVSDTLLQELIDLKRQ